jgi:short subunit fatty acids transporter
MITKKEAETVMITKKEAEKFKRICQEFWNLSFLETAKIKAKNIIEFIDSHTEL